VGYFDLSGLVDNGLFNLSGYLVSVGYVTVGYLILLGFEREFFPFGALARGFFFHLVQRLVHWLEEDVRCNIMTVYSCVDCSSPKHSRSCSIGNSAMSISTALMRQSPPNNDSKGIEAAACVSAAWE
jgi:hypothetical protein